MKFEIARVSAGLRPHARPIEIATLEEVRPGRLAWTVELATLEDLMELRAHAQYDLVIGMSYICDGLPEITIYDDYME